MLLRFFLYALLFLSITVAAQNTKHSQIILEAADFQEGGRFEAAIKKYDEILLANNKNVNALAEKAHSLVGLKEYKKAIATCKKALKIESGDTKSIKLVYTTYGNALDLEGHPKSALKMYNKGLTKFPEFYSLHYNKGVTLSGMNDFGGAIAAFQHSVQFRPSHAASFLALGRMLEFEERNISALLCYMRFHTIEPDSERAKENLKKVKGLIFSNVEKIGDNTVIINVSTSGLVELGGEEKPENSFQSVALILSMQSALDLGGNKGEKTEVEIFEEKLSSIFSIMEDTKDENSGFYWDFVVPYFIELHQNEYEKVLAHLLYSNQDDFEVNEYLNNNEDFVRDFYDWSGAFEWK
jgi:tetratricopeptide (TPR) repeat protein